MRRQAQIRFPALMADEPPLRVLGDTPVYACADGLPDARRRLVSVLAARRFVVAQAEAV